MSVKNLILFVFLGALYPVKAQSYAVEWGELQRANGQLIYVLPDTKDDFYALRWTGGRLFGSYQVSHHHELTTDEKGKLRMQVDNSIASFENAVVIDGKLLVFLSDRRGEERLIFMQEYTKQIEPKGKGVQLTSYNTGKIVDRGWFDVIVSENEQYFAVIWEIPGKKDERDRYGFKIFDLDWNVINEGDYSLPFEPDLATIHNHHLSNQGDYFLSITEYQRDENQGVFKSNTEFKALHIFHIAQDGLQDFTLNVDGRRIEAMAISSADSLHCTITGIYGDMESQGVKGVFFQRVQLQTHEVLEEGFREFDKDFVTQDWSERERERADRREDRGKGEPQLYNYIMRDAVMMDDGSIVGTLEQFFVQIRSSSSGQVGQLNNVYYYYYNDIIAYKIDSSGVFQWIKKINKYQVSTNDGGPYSSYKSFLDNGQLNFIFNDNWKNYDDAGNYLELDQINAASYTPKKNVVAIASINLETGEQQRKTLFDRSEIGAIAVPKMFHVDYQYNEMLMYTILGRKEKFGILKFND